MPDWRDRIVWFVWSNGSHLNSLTQELISYKAYSLFLILLDEQSAYCAFQNLLRLACWWTALLTQLTLFTFRVLDRSCLSLFRIASQSDFSLDPLFIVDSIHMSRATHECGFPVIDCANILSSINAACSVRRVSSTAMKSGRWHQCHRPYCRCHRFASKEAW